MNIKKFLNQKAVYWGAPVSNGYGGYSYSDPVEVDVRWSDKQEVFRSSVSGGSKGSTSNAQEEQLSRAMVMSETDMDVKGRLFLGTLDDLTSDGLPDSNDALTIEAFSKIPDKKAVMFLRKVWLV